MDAREATEETVARLAREALEAAAARLPGPPGAPLMLTRPSATCHSSWHSAEVNSAQTRDGEEAGRV